MGINPGLSLQSASILAVLIATGLPADTLQGHRDRFHEQFRRYPGLMQDRGILCISSASSLSHFSFLPLSSLKNFFKKASDMLYFKRLIQIPRLPEVCHALRAFGCAHSQEGPEVLQRGSKTHRDVTVMLLSPQSPPNFLRASALAEHVKPVVVIPEEAPEDEEPENLIEISTTSTMEPQVGGVQGWDGDMVGRRPEVGARIYPGTFHPPQVTSDLFEQTFGPPNGIRDDR